MPTRRLILTASFAATLAATVVAVLAATVTAPALAFERPFPTFAKRGTMKPGLFPTITIDGRPRILTPGGRIWSADNLIAMPASLPEINVVVNYTEDEQSYIDRVWILSAEEAAQSPKAQNINQPRQ